MKNQIQIIIAEASAWPNWLTLVIVIVVALLLLGLFLAFKTNILSKIFQERYDSEVNLVVAYNASDSEDTHATDTGGTTFSAETGVLGETESPVSVGEAETEGASEPGELEDSPYGETYDSRTYYDRDGNEISREEYDRLSSKDENPEETPSDDENPDPDSPCTTQPDGGSNPMTDPPAEFPQEAVDSDEPVIEKDSDSAETEYDCSEAPSTAIIPKRKGQQTVKKKDYPAKPQRQGRRTKRKKAKGKK